MFIGATIDELCHPRVARVLRNESQAHPNHSPKTAASGVQYELFFVDY
ncbi:MAG: hypothetical protein Q4G13_03275 [Moraxella sp.]|nr:hypothetical protein [Moraxella sp.]